ncbi:MAG: hypothetical protein QOG92_511 [Verrucomicrobiota bacterium]|nr:hypothetical protein [Verrucomicrobiota bacterium]
MQTKFISAKPDRVTSGLLVIFALDSTEKDSKQKDTRQKKQTQPAV